MQTTKIDPTALLTTMLAHPERFPDDLVVLRRDSGLLARAFSAESLRILQLLEREGPVKGISRLADRLARDRTRVSKDIHFLEGLGLLEIERRGRATIVTSSKTLILVQ